MFYRDVVQLDESRVASAAARSSRDHWGNWRISVGSASGGCVQGLSTRCAQC